MFPGYVLVESEEIIKLAEIVRNCKGLFRFLKNESEFQEIRLEEILAIVYMTDEVGVIGISEVIAKGSFIEVVNGPLKGYEGLIRKVDKRHRRAKVEFLFEGGRHLIDLGVYIRKENISRFITKINERNDFLWSAEAFLIRTRQRG